MSDGEHQHESVLVKKIDALGRYRFTAQCVTCGRIDTQRLKKMGFGIWAPLSGLEVPFESLKDWDDSIAERYGEAMRIKRERQWEEVKARLEAEREEKSRQWWDEYDAFLKTSRWREKRIAVIARDGNVCQACLRRPIQAVHHKTYEHGVDAPLFDLVGVCHVCHQALHPDKEMSQ
jgi:hypothetical protein